LQAFGKKSISVSGLGFHALGLKYVNYSPTDAVFSYFCGLVYRNGSTKSAKYEKESSIVYDAAGGCGDDGLQQR
jgi:hypothetical protein